MVLSDVTPGASFDNGEAQMWSSVGRLADQLTEAAKPSMKRRAEERGAREGAEAAAQTVAGQPAEAPRPLLAFGEMAEARMAAAEQAYHAGVRSDFDARENEVSLEFSHDPEAYRERMAGVRSAFIQNAPPEYAVDLEQYSTNRINVGAGSISARAAAVQLNEQAATLAGRMASLGQQMVDETTDNGGPTPRYEILRYEYESVRQARLDNPAIPYSETEAAADDRELATLGKAAVYTHHARGLFREEGAAAALGSLEAILTDADLAESERSVVFEKARATINREIDLATDQANMARSAQTRAEEAMRERVADNVAAVEIGLEGDGLTESEVMITLGPDGVRDWYRSTAEALERNREVGSLVGLSSEEAAARIADARAVSEGGAEFESLVNWIIDDSEGTALVADDNGAGRARFGITERSHPDAWRDGDVTRQEAAAIYRREYWDAIGADGLAKDLRIVAFDAAINQGAGLARQWIRESGGDASRFMDLRRTHYRALAASNPAKYADDLPGWLNRLDAVVSRVQAMGAGNLLAESITNARQGFASDPITFATTHRLAAPIELPVDAVFQGGAATDQWGEAIRSRFALSGNLASEYQVPQRILTNGEVAAYRDRFARDPGAAVEFAEQASRFIGGRGARDALAEIGREGAAPATIHIATLAISGGSARFADNAARGLQLKASGEKLDTDRAGDITEAINAVRAPFASNPPLLQAIRATAEAAALADTVGGVGGNRSAEYYAQSSMGRTQSNGQTYGGVTAVNGRQTLLPTWLNPDFADDALEELAALWVRQETGPVYANDTPMPANVVAGLRMEMQPNGRYRLVDREGRFAYSRRGHAFELDLEGGREWLSGRLGRAGVKPE